MKINGRPDAVDTLSATPAAGKGAKRATQAAAAPSAVDHVHLSPLAAQTRANGASADSFDAGRVAEIKQAIAEGRLSIDPHAIADKLLAQAQALAGKERK